MAFSHQPSPRPKRKKGSPAHLILKPRSARTTPKNSKGLKKKRENGCLGKAIFPSSLGAVLKALKGGISKTPPDFQKFNDYAQELVFFINHQTWKIHQGKGSAVAPTKNQKR